MGVVFLVLVQNLLYALFTIVSRRLAVRFTDAQFQVSAVLFTCLYIVALPIAFLASEVRLSDLWQWLPILVPVSIAIGLQSVITFWILRYMDAAIGSLVGMLSVVSTVIMATILLDEGLSLQQLAGGVLIIGSVAYVLSMGVNPGERRNWTIGLLLALISCALVAAGMTGEKYLLGQMPLGSYLVWGVGLQWLAVLIISFIYQAKQYATVLQRSSVKLLGAAALLRTVSAAGFIASMLLLNNVSQVMVLGGLKVILAAILGMIILRERQFIRRKLIAASATALGVAVMFWPT